MSARGLALVAAVVTLLGGVFALFNAPQALPWIGFQALPNRDAWAYGEIRATYGGLFVVLGVYGILAALDPPANRARLVMLGLCWWGIAAGRLVGITVDGSPGGFGWGYLAFETTLGALYVAAATTANGTPAAVAQPSMPSETPAA